MTTEQTVGFIGAGNIAEAMIRGLITSGTLDPGQIAISDVNEARLLQLHRTLGATITTSNEENAARSKILFLAVKPAQVVDVARGVSGAVGPDHAVVSVAAGTSLGRIRAALGPAPRLFRIMPNLATSVRRSTIGIVAEPGSADGGADGPVHALLGSMGTVFRIADEAQMAAVTALSGSAPAYYVMMADALIQFGVSQGMPREVATAMILGTMEGSAAWAASSRVPLEELWRRVVTPGGTTAAGIDYYTEKGFLDIFVEGLTRSTQRARELGDR
jgi:pyrroline-5-carboxylate reductase